MQAQMKRSIWPRSSQASQLAIGKAEEPDIATVTSSPRLQTAETNSPVPPHGNHGSMRESEGSTRAGKIRTKQWVDGCPSSSRRSRTTGGWDDEPLRGWTEGRRRIDGGSDGPRHLELSSLLLFPSFPAPAPEVAATVTGHPGVTAAGERRVGESKDVRLPDRQTRGARADGTRTSRNGRRGRAATGRRGGRRRRAANGEERRVATGSSPLDSSSRIRDGRMDAWVTAQRRGWEREDGRRPAEKRAAMAAEGRSDGQPGTGRNGRRDWRRPELGVGTTVPHVRRS